MRCGLYQPRYVVPLDDAAAAAGEKYLADAMSTGELERLLPHDSSIWLALQDLLADQSFQLTKQRLALPIEEIEILPPIARPPKLLLLAGNYDAHIKEQGEQAAERENTFPYVFMKPPSTTLLGDRASLTLPSISPHKIDHEVELAIVIGRTAQNVSSDTALQYVAGYTVINDISDRGFRPNSSREERPRDRFFDWQHGKWHDRSCPCGPCMVTHDEIPDPQKLAIKLTVDGETRQSGSTGEQIFSVAEVIEFISSWVTLEPGDIISTGTPSGVGNATGRFLRAGQNVEATIESIGTLTTHIN